MYEKLNMDPALYLGTKDAIVNKATPLLSMEFIPYQERGQQQLSRTAKA